MTDLPRLLPLCQALSLNAVSLRPFSSTSTAHTSTKRARNIAYMRDKADRLHAKKIGKIQHAQEAKQEQKADDQEIIEGEISKKEEMSAREKREEEYRKKKENEKKRL